MPRLDDTRRWELLPARPDDEARLSTELGLPRLVARVLAARGVREPDEARSFLTPSLDRDWHDPLEVPGMGEAADRVALALARHERIAVFGDYDVDGITATTLLAGALRRLGGDVSPFVPHRFDEGYGLSEAALARVRAACSPELVITVDNGIAAAREVAGLVADGIDVVVTDHHEPGELVPRGVPVTNPKLASDGPSRELAGAGVALKLVCELGRRLGRVGLWRDYVDLAALGTLSDMMQLTPENRALVSEGVARLRESSRPGVVALATAAGVSLVEVRPDTLPFSLIPRLNAAGRMGATDVALDLLLSDDPAEAAVLAGRLEEINDERRRTESELAQVVLDQVAATYHGERAIVVAGEGWHEGVKGIVASRVVGRYHVPAIVLSVHDGVARGSGRSVGSVDLFRAVESCADVLVRFGGHAGAVGVTVEEGRVGEFRERLCRALDALPAEQFEDRGEVACVVGLDELTQGSIEGLEALQPFGQGNKRPLFAVRDVTMRSRSRVGADGAHLRFVAADGRTTRPAIMFRVPEIERAASWEGPCDLVFEAVNETWQGRTKPKLMVRDILLPGDGPGASRRAPGPAPDTRAPGGGPCAPDPEARGRRAALEALPADALDDELRRALVGDHPLLPAQAAALDVLSQGRSCLAVMATGRGKSLVFHLHAARLAVARHLASVFVYPLRALVADQAFHLGGAFASLGLVAAVLTGETPEAGRADVLRGLADGSVDVVLTTPEFLAIHAGELAACGLVGFVVVDEAHHAAHAEGGRDAYARLPEVLETLGSPQVLATSATVDAEAGRQVCRLLGIDPGDVVEDATRRDNLEVDDLRGEPDRAGALARVVATGEKCVAYVGTREGALRLVRSLRRTLPGQAARVAFYHAGLSRPERSQVEAAFRAGELTCVVSTSAFGEGVNLPDVRHVALMELPYGRVSFNQMSGRAGRDGAAAFVHLLFGDDDVARGRRVLAAQAPDRRALAALYRALLASARGARSRGLDDFAEDDAALAAAAADLDAASPLAPSAVAGALGVFSELGFVRLTGFGEARRVALVARPDHAELTDSVRYLEGLRAQREFEDFAAWALDAEADELVATVRSPILPGMGRRFGGA